MPDRWQQVSQLFDAALAKQASERAAFLAEACAGDDMLRREVESLLTHEGTAEGFLAVPALEVAAKVLAEPSGSLNPQRLALIPGTRLGPYKVLAPLGAGGMGEVYRAKDTRLRREVAIKLLPQGVRADPERLQRFEQEARAAAALNHPNVAAVYDVDEVDDLHFIVMEYVNGETLRTKIAEGPLAPADLRNIAAQIVDALRICPLSRNHSS